MYSIYVSLVFAVMRDSSGLHSVVVLPRAGYVEVFRGMDLDPMVALALAGRAGCVSIYSEVTLKA